MTHVGVVIMVVGVVVGAILGERGYMQLYIGHSGNTFYAGRKERIALPFVVHLEDFRVERYRGRLVQERLIVQVADRGLVSDFPVDVGRKFEVTGTPYSVTTLRYEPDFLVLGPGSYGSRSSEPNNPAIQVQVDGGSDSRTEWVFAKFPGMHRGPDSNVWLFYRRIGTIGRIKAFKSDVRLYEGGRVVASKTIEVNKPLKHRGYSIYQSDYDAEEELYSVLGITRDPGVSLVYAGFVLISAGLLFNFYLRPLG